VDKIGGHVIVRETVYGVGQQSQSPPLEDFQEATENKNAIAN